MIREMNQLILATMFHLTFRYESFDSIHI